MHSIQPRARGRARACSVLLWALLWLAAPAPGQETPEAEASAADAEGWVELPEAAPTPEEIEAERRAAEQRAAELRARREAEQRAAAQRAAEQREAERRAAERRAAEAAQRAAEERAAAERAAQQAAEERAAAERAAQQPAPTERLEARPAAPEDAEAVERADATQAEGGPAAAPPTQEKAGLFELTLEEAAALLDRSGEARASASGDGAARPAPPVTWDSIVARAALVAREAPERIPPFVHRALDDLAAGRITRRAQVVAGAGVALVVLLLTLIARAARGSGDVQVLLQYPSELKGTFSVRTASRKSRKSRVCRIKTREDAHRQGASSRTEHHLVSRETSFRGLPCRRVWVSVEGFLETEGGEVVSTHLVEQEARPRRRGIVRLEFDLSPRACPVEVRVAWDRRAIEGALVARRGAPGSMRFARGAVHFSLDLGTHVLVVGSADRVCEVPVEIRSFQPLQLEIDMADRRHLLFSGCPPAVEPYLNGDVPAAARALERDGQHEACHRMLARFHLDRDNLDTAAKHYEKAGSLHEAADLYQSLTQFEKAAQLFEQAGEDERAAENYRSAGKLLRAGDAYARADDYDSAVECFKRAGDTARWIEALEKKGAVFEAARIALDQGDRSRAIRCLTRISTDDPDYPEAALRLAEAYQDQGHQELAFHKIDEMIAARRDEDLDEQGLDRASKVLEGAGEYERALQLLERLRQRDAAYPHLATRIEDLRKKKSESLSAGGTRIAAASVPGASAFSNEFRYEILEELGRGGMGIVFKARDRRLGRIVALKRLPDNLRNHPKAVELFLREARAAAALNHPNIVTLFDAGQEDETFYLTMELLEGTPLQKVLAARGRLAPAHVAKLAGQVATGLEFAHDQGIVHRDIKTANLFFTNKRIVKIMDFGLAKMVEEVRRATTVIGGTPYYMAPEQSAGDAIDRRADLYALGVTLFELLTGTVPFKEGDVAFHHRHTPPPDVRDVAPDVPEAFAALVAEMLRKRPDERIDSAAEVRARLQQLARG